MNWLKKLRSRVKSDRGDAILVMSVIMVPFFLLCGGFAMDLTKAVWVKQQYQTMAQESTNYAAQSIHTTGAITEEAVTRAALSYEYKRAGLTIGEGSNLFGNAVGGKDTIGTREAIPSVTGACTTVNIAGSTPNPITGDVPTPVYKTAPYYEITIQNGRDNDSSKAPPIVFRGNRDSIDQVANGNTYNKNLPYYSVKMKVWDTAPNMVMGMFGRDCQTVVSEVSTITFGSQSDIEENVDPLEVQQDAFSWLDPYVHNLGAPNDRITYYSCRWKDTTVSWKRPDHGSLWLRTVSYYKNGAWTPQAVAGDLTGFDTANSSYAGVEGVLVSYYEESGLIYHVSCYNKDVVNKPPLACPSATISAGGEVRITPVSGAVGYRLVYPGVSAYNSYPLATSTDFNLGAYISNWESLTGVRILAYDGWGHSQDCSLIAIKALPKCGTISIGSSTMPHNIANIANKWKLDYTRATGAATTGVIYEFYNPKSGDTDRIDVGNTWSVSTANSSSPFGDIGAIVNHTFPASSGFLKAIPYNEAGMNLSCPRLPASQLANENTARSYFLGASRSPSTTPCGNATATYKNSSVSGQWRNIEIQYNFEPRTPTSTVMMSYAVGAGYGGHVTYHPGDPTTGTKSIRVPSTVMNTNVSVVGLATYDNATGGSSTNSNTWVLCDPS